MATGFLGLKNKLEEQGIEVFRPEFPTPENQKLESWLKILDESEIEIDEDAVLIEAQPWSSIQPEYFE
jgi:predicted alpha/beta hydrolase family esterase